MEPESAEAVSRARDAARDAATASIEAATLEAAAELERAAFRARRDVSGARADGRKTRVDVPRTPREAETRARRTREASAEDRRAREKARMRAAGVHAAARGGDGSVRSAAALDAERRARWLTHEARWASFRRDDAAAALAVPFPSSGEDLLLGLRSVFSVSRARRAADDDRGCASDADRAALNSAFRAAALRWHPDKFAQTFAARLARAPAAERAETERRVAETFRDVRRAYERALREAA